KETAAKDKPTTIYMVRSWQRTVKQKITQTSEQGKEITFPPLTNSNGTDGPLVIEAEKKRGQAPERTKAIQAEVEKLVEAGIMREVYYHDWLSNPVMDCYPLPEIDWKIESLCGYPFKCFLDAYKGYHQIQMAAADEEKTGIQKPNGTKYRGICGRLGDKKSHRDGNAKGVFFGYVITPEGIKPCPDKTTAVLQLQSPQTIKEVQSLNGKLASLNRFLSKSAEKSLPLF
nr:hypothetical protein [Tanacetum cinerariifolium]